DGCVGTIESEHPKEGDHPKQDGQHPKEGLAGMEIEQGWDKSQEIIYQSNVLSSSFTHINIPFYEPSPVKGGYIRLFDCFGFPLTSSHLIFTFSTTSKETVFKKFEFPEFEYLYWCFLPVDLFDVTACEITGQGRCSSKKIGKEKLDFHIQITSLVFISREETPEEIIFREAREKLWSKSAVVKPEFMKEGDEESDSKLYYQSLSAQKMLKGEDSVEFSHLSIPFRLTSFMKGAYICVDMFNSSHSLLFTFTDCDGTSFLLI
ncbi:hypothetical protein ADUPG1_013791, partial [Aduncisulcus paluster]